MTRCWGRRPRWLPEWTAGPAFGAIAAPAAAATPMSYLGGWGSRAYPVVALTWESLIVSIVVCIIIALLVAWGVMARRSRSVFGPIGSQPVSHPPRGLKWITWGVGISFIPLLVSLVWTVEVLAQVNQPKGAEPFTIEIIGHQWWWEVRYKDADPHRTFVTANEIHIPVGHPVRVEVKSDDVIHSFWIPALGGKMDTIPGQTNVTWLEADHAGRYRGQCTEYCGLQHAHMAVFAIADAPTVFAQWWQRQLADAPAPATPEAQQGQALFVVKCGACHTVQGTLGQGKVAPNLTHLMGRETIAAGAALNTPAGLAGWIANPQGVKPGTKMPTLYLSGAELKQLRTYLESLK